MSFMLQRVTECLTPCVWDRYDGTRSLHSHFFAYITEVSLLQHAGPRSVAPSGCGHGKRREEMLSGLSLLQRQGSGDRKGMTRGEWLRGWFVLILGLMWHLCVHASQPLHFLSDEVYTAIPWSVCLHGPHSCDWCVRTDRDTSSLEGACCSSVASGSCLPVWGGFEPWGRGCHIHTRNRLRGQLLGFAQHRWVTRSCARQYSVYFP